MAPIHYSESFFSYKRRRPFYGKGGLVLLSGCLESSSAWGLYLVTYLFLTGGFDSDNDTFRGMAQTIISMSLRSLPHAQLRAVEVAEVWEDFSSEASLMRRRMQRGPGIVAARARSH